jgi:DNA topoisomerase-2
LYCGISYLIYEKGNCVRIVEFYNTDFASFSSYSAFRGIANVIDGQKPSSRKVLCSIKNLKEKTKVASLASRIVDTLEYIHGATSLEGVITGMAQDFVGTNNINLLEPKGDFGSVCIQKAGAGRYIYVNKQKVYDKILCSDDECILEEQEFEGTKIEPKFYVPIIPLILVNGSEGIGTGFAQKILPRNPKTLIKLLQNTCEHKTQIRSSILPYFEGFSGEIVKTGDASYDIKGKFERLNTNTIMVTELPVGYDIEKYSAILTKLEDDKVITDFTDKSEPKDNKFLFEIKATREFVKLSDETLMDKLKLVKKVTENFTCIGINNEIVEFKSELEILDYYVTCRLDYYAKRKDWLINKIKEELMVAGSKFYFVKLILEDKIKVFKQPKDAIIKQIEESEAFPFYKRDDSFQYLINMPVHSFSNETIEELKKQISAKKEELKVYTEKSINSMWLDDLNELTKALKGN